MKGGKEGEKEGEQSEKRCLILSFLSFELELPLPPSFPNTLPFSNSRFPPLLVHSFQVECVQHALLPRVELAFQSRN